MDLWAIEHFDGFLIVGTYFIFVERFIFLFLGRTSLLELQQPFVIFTDLFCHDYLLAFCFFLDLRKHLLPRVNKNLFEILQVAFLSFKRTGLEFGSFFLFDWFEARSFFSERLDRRTNFQFGFFSSV